MFYIIDSSLHRNSHPKWYIYPLALIVAAMFMKSAEKVILKLLLIQPYPSGLRFLENIDL